MTPYLSLSSDHSFFADIYGPVISQSEELTSHFMRLDQAIGHELKYQDTLEELGGMLDTLLAASRVPEMDSSSKTNGVGGLDMLPPLVEQQVVMNGDDKMDER